MLALYGRNEAIDLVTMTNELQKEGKLEDAGGVSYLTLLANVVPTAANVKYHAQIVEEKSILRQLVEGGTRIATLGYEGAEEVKDIMDEAEKTILRISHRKGGKDLRRSAKWWGRRSTRFPTSSRRKAALRGSVRGSSILTA